MTPESNVRGMLSPDQAYERWQAEGYPNIGYEPIEREAFKAGWMACIEALIDAKKIKLVVNG